LPFINVTDIIDDEEKQVQEDMRTDPEVKDAIEKFESECEFRRKMIDARKASGLTQKQLEQTSGLKQQAISRMERDTANSPSISTLIKYLDCIGYKLDIVPK